MQDFDNMAHRLAMHHAAMATTGIDPAWDKALHAYIKADILQNAELEFGSVARAAMQRQTEQVEIEVKYGKEWKSIPEAQALDRVSFEKMQSADDHWANTVCRAYWRAGRELALTPAPSMAAIAFKATVIELNEMDNDRDFPADPMEVLHADFARLAGEA